MNKCQYTSLLMLLVLVPLGPALNATGVESFDFGLLRDDTGLVVWMDFAPFVSSSRLDKLQDGIDLAVEYKLTLAQPRRFWGTSTVTRTTGAVTVGYRLVTGDYHLTSIGVGLSSKWVSLSLASLHRYLSDSIVVRLIDFSKLDSLQHYVLKLELTCIPLTDFNLAPADSTSTVSASPVKYMFKQFLKYTGFGRQEYSAETRAISLGEIPQK